MTQIFQILFFILCWNCNSNAFHLPMKSISKNPYKWNLKSQNIIDLDALYPDVDSFNDALKSICEKKSKKNLKEAEDLLFEMEDHVQTNNKVLRLNIYSYTTVLDAWCKCREAQKAHDLLQRMIDNQISSNDYLNHVIPNTVAFNIVINAWAKISGHPNKTDPSQKVLELLSFMEDQYKYNQSCLCAPNTM